MTPTKRAGSRRRELENMKRLAEEERARAEESRNNEQIAKRLAKEERRTRLELGRRQRFESCGQNWGYKDARDVIDI